MPCSLSIRTQPDSREACFQHDPGLHLRPPEGSQIPGARCVARLDRSYGYALRHAPAGHLGLCDQTYQGFVIVGTSPQNSRLPAALLHGLHLDAPFGGGFLSGAAVGLGKRGEEDVELLIQNAAERYDYAIANGGV